MRALVVIVYTLFCAMVGLSQGSNPVVVRGNTSLDPLEYLSFSTSLLKNEDGTTKSDIEAFFGGWYVVGYIKSERTLVISHGKTGNPLQFSGEPLETYFLKIDVDKNSSQDDFKERIEPIKMKEASPFNNSNGDPGGSMCSGGVLGDDQFYIGLCLIPESGSLAPPKEFYMIEFNSSFPSESKWKAKAPIPSIRSRWSSIIVDGMLYALNPHENTHPSGIHMKYNYTGDEWSDMADVPSTLLAHNSYLPTLATFINVVPQRDFFMITTTKRAEPKTTPFQNLFKFDTISNEWTLVAESLPIYTEDQLLSNTFWRNTQLQYWFFSRSAFVYRDFHNNGTDKLRVLGGSGIQPLARHLFGGNNVLPLNMLPVNYPTVGKELPSGIDFEVDLETLVLNVNPVGTSVTGAYPVGVPMNVSSSADDDGMYYAIVPGGMYASIAGSDEFDVYLANIVHVVKPLTARMPADPPTTGRGEVFSVTSTPVVPNFEFFDQDEPFNLYQDVIIGRSVVSQVLPVRGSSMTLDERSFMFYSGGLKINLPYGVDTTRKVFAWHLSEPDRTEEMDPLPDEVGGFGHCLVTYQTTQSGGDDSDFSIVAIGGADATGAKFGAAAIRSIAFGVSSMEGFVDDKEWEVFTGDIEVPFVSGGCLSVVENGTLTPMIFLLGGVDELPSTTKTGMFKKPARVVLVKLDDSNLMVLETKRLPDAPFSTVILPAMSRMQSYQGPVMNSPPFGDSDIYVFGGGYMTNIFSEEFRNVGIMHSIRSLGCWKYVERHDYWVALQSMSALAVSSVAVLQFDRYIYLFGGIGSANKFYYRDDPSTTMVEFNEYPIQGTSQTTNFFNNVATSSSLIYVYDILRNQWVNNTLPFAPLLPSGGFWGATSNQMAINRFTDLPQVSSPTATIYIPEATANYDSSGVVRFDFYAGDVDTTAAPPEVSIDGSNAAAIDSVYSIFLPSDALAESSMLFLPEGAVSTKVNTPAVCNVGGTIPLLDTTVSQFLYRTHDVNAVDTIRCVGLPDPPGKRRLLQLGTLPYRVLMHTSFYVNSTTFSGILTYGGVPRATVLRPYSQFIFTTLEGVSQEVYYPKVKSTELIGGRMRHFGFHLQDGFSVFGCGLFAPESQLGTVFRPTGITFMILMDTSTSMDMQVTRRLQDFIFGPTFGVAVTLNREKTRAYVTPGIPTTTPFKFDIESESPGFSYHTTFSGNRIAIWNLNGGAANADHWSWTVTPLMTTVPMSPVAFPVELKNVYLNLRDSPPVDLAMMSASSGFEKGLHPGEINYFLSDDLINATFAVYTLSMESHGRVSNMDTFLRVGATYTLSYGNNSVEFENDGCDPKKHTRLPQPCQDPTVSFIGNDNIRTLWNENTTFWTPFASRSFPSRATVLTQCNTVLPRVPPMFSETENTIVSFSEAGNNLPSGAPIVQISDFVTVFFGSGSGIFSVDVGKLLEGETTEAYVDAPSIDTANPPKIGAFGGCAFPDQNFIIVVYRAGIIQSGTVFFPEGVVQRWDYNISDMSQGQWQRVGGDATWMSITRPNLACFREREMIIDISTMSEFHVDDNTVVTGQRTFLSTASGGVHAGLMTGVAVSPDENIVYILSQESTSFDKQSATHVLMYNVDEDRWSLLEPIVYKKMNAGRLSPVALLCGARMLAVVPGDVLVPKGAKLTPNGYADPRFEIFPVMNFGIFGEPDDGILVPMPPDAVSPFRPPGYDIGNLERTYRIFYNSSTDNPFVGIHYGNRSFAYFPLDCSSVHLSAATAEDDVQTTTMEPTTTTIIPTTEEPSTLDDDIPTESTTATTPTPAATTGEQPTTTEPTTPPPSPPPTQPAPTFDPDVSTAKTRPAFTTIEIIVSFIFILLTCVLCGVIMFLVQRYPQRLRHLFLG